LYILPRLTDSLHPGSGGNPGFNVYDLDNMMRLVFYPSIIAWTLLVLWVTSLRVRMSIIKEKIDESY
jgi:heme exporter protein C